MESAFGIYQFYFFTRRARVRMLAVTGEWAARKKKNAEKYYICKRPKKKENQTAAARMHVQKQTCRESRVSGIAAVGGKKTARH